MSERRQIKNALISVFYKEGLEGVASQLQQMHVNIYSTGGTMDFLESKNIPVKAVENLTSYPSILGGRVKTLHPKVFGGILSRRHNPQDNSQLEEFEIPSFDLVLVDLYPFEETVKSGASEEDIIEKIDIGGISLIRAAAKNFKDVIVVSSKNQYSELLGLLKNKNGSDLEDRKKFALEAFKISSSYDTAIRDYFDQTTSEKRNIIELRYGENPHQKGFFHGNFDEMFDKLHGKELSYNNLLDVDAAVNLMLDFKNDEPTFAILKHNNACGIASRKTIREAYEAALAGDPVSAFGGILISNKSIDKATAELIHELFCEVVIAPDFEDAALEILKGKKNRILLRQKSWDFPDKTKRTALNGELIQDRDTSFAKKESFEQKTIAKPTEEEEEDLVFASKIVKHTKSNAIVLAKGKQLLASGTGQTSRVDALQQAIIKAKNFKFDLNGAVMASDAFFPFPDCVEIAGKEGIKAVVQPGGSVKDQLSIDYCNEHDIAMVFTGTRHFKH